ncbi:MAG: ABC transporter substrate-binding protein [Eubacteriales bacterium]|nr:ABC transporter substrate-binding protein [Eubacteriales bacterium]
MRKTGLLSAVLFLSILTGCAGQYPAESETPAAALFEETEPSEGRIVVGFCETGSESDWRRAHAASIRSALSEEEGFYLLYEDAQQKLENQIKAVRRFILQDVDYIVFSPLVKDGWDVVLEEAKEAGIPVIVNDRQVDVSEDLYTCWIGSDAEKEGRDAGLWLADYLEKEGRDKEQINIVTIQGTLGASIQIGRKDGFAEVLSEHDNWTMLDMQTGDFTQTKGYEVMEDFLEKYDDIDVVVSENDNMTFGAIDAIHDAGKTCGPDGDIIILSFDAVHAALEQMQKGDINADFECNPMQGEKVKEIILALEAGREVEKKMYVEETYFDNTMDLEEILKTRMY